MSDHLTDILGFVRLAVVVAGFAIGGCYDNAPTPIQPIPDGPGSEAWGDPNVACTDDDECMSSEMCQDSICQMKRCQDGPYSTAPPVGREAIFYNDFGFGLSQTVAF